MKRFKYLKLSGDFSQRKLVSTNTKRIDKLVRLV